MICTRCDQEANPKYKTCDNPNSAKTGGHAFWWRILKQGCPPGLDVLCWNCHMALDHYGACPHTEQERLTV